MTYQSTRMDGRSSSADALARGLGWFSVLLGVTEVLAAHRLTRALGMEGKEGLVEAYGLREIATGVAILSTEDPTPWIWGRVGGDALDLGTLAMGLRRDNPERDKVGIAMGTVAAVTVLDVVCAQMLTAEHRRPVMPPRDYSRRSGLPKPAAQMRGAASDATIPADMRTPRGMQYPPPREPVHGSASPGTTAGSPKIV